MGKKDGWAGGVAFSTLSEGRKGGVGGCFGKQGGRQRTEM